MFEISKVDPGFHGQGSRHASLLWRCICFPEGQSPQVGGYEAARDFTSRGFGAKCSSFGTWTSGFA